MSYVAEHANIPGLKGIWEAPSMEGPPKNEPSTSHLGTVPAQQDPATVDRGLGLRTGHRGGHGSGQTPGGAECATHEVLGFAQRRLEHQVPFTPKLQVPCFTEGVETSPCAYVLHSVIYHIGCAPDSGHYRTLGVTNLLHEL